MSEAVSSQISFFGVSYDAIFTTVFTIIVFTIGLYINKIIKRNKEKKRLKDLEVYYLDLLSSLIGPIDRHSQSFKALADSIIDKKARNFEFKGSSEIFIDVFGQLPHQDIYKIFIVDTKSSGDERYVHYRNILTAIEFLKFQRERSKRNVDRFMRDLRRYESDWNANVTLIGRSFDKYISIMKSQGIKISQDPFLKEFDTLCSNLQKLDDFQNMYVSKENFVDPMKKHCQVNIGDPRAFELIQFIVSANYAFDKIFNLKELYSESFQGESDKLEGFKNQLEQAVEFFRNA